MGETREQLIEAARDVLLEGGLFAFSMRKVAARCGLSATAIYRHFEDKDALLASAIAEAFSILGRYLMDGLSHPEPLGRFRSMSEQYFAFAHDHQPYYQLMFMTNCADLGLDRLDQATETRASGMFQLLVDRIEECQHARVFQSGDSRAQAAFVWSSYHGLVALSLTGNLEAADLLVLRAPQIEGVVAALQSGQCWSPPIEGSGA